jgi:transposase-like protein
MNSAINEVLSRRMTVTKAAKYFDVPRETLRVKSLKYRTEAMQFDNFT